MTTSSAQDTYSITLDNNQDTISFPAWDNMASSSDTITITNGGSSYSIGSISGAGSYTTNYTSSAGATVGGITNIGTISSIDTSAFTFNLSEEWVNCFPDFVRIEKMCKEYPGLAIAFEKFKTTYKLVKDHYDTPEDKRPKP